MNDTRLTNKMRGLCGLTTGILVGAFLIGARPSAAQQNPLPCDFLPDFTEMPIELTGVEHASVAWGDYDNDGNLDLAVAGVPETSSPFADLYIYRNDGAGGFVKQVSFSNVDEAGKLTWGDYNNDGHLDLLAIRTIYRNNGDGSFTAHSLPNEYTSQPFGAWGDYDNDGDLDLLLANFSSTRIYRNDGDFAFVDIGAPLPTCSGGSAEWGDYDNDGDLDILLTGASGQGSIARVYRNDGGGTFTDINAALPEVRRSSATWGDYDNDGDLDILLTGNTDDGRFAGVFRNNGGLFTQIQTDLIPVGWGTAAWGDYDNDGDLDILLVGSNASRVYRNEGNGVFADIGDLFEGVIFGAAAWGDFDNDGDLDIALAGFSRPPGPDYVPTAKIYRNNACIANTPPSEPLLYNVTVNEGSATFHWGFGFDLETDELGLNYNLRVGTAPGLSDVKTPMADAGTGLRRIAARGNVDSTLTHTIHGLTPGKTYYWSVQAIDTAFAASPFASEQGFTVPALPCVIVCPEDINVTVDDPCATGTYLEYPLAENTGGCEGELTYSHPNPSFFPMGQTEVIVTSADELTSCSFMVNVSVAPVFVDINAPLIGVRDGALDWGDYDGDGDMDLVIAGWDGIGNGISTTIYRNDDGVFTNIRADLVEVHQCSVHWGDYDGDGDLDLALTGFSGDGYVTRIYRNDGNDTFMDIEAGIPGVFGGCIQWGDFDNDGDLDILISGSISTGAISRVYENQDSTFVDINAGLTGVGNSTVRWGDLNGDGYLDIFLNGGIGITTIYLNNGDKTFTATNAGLPSLLYTGADLGDFDNDGDLDILIAGLSSVGQGVQPVSRIYRNDNGNFTEIQAGLTGLAQASAQWGDYDNDGDLDVLLTGYSLELQTTEYHTLVYRNDGGTFTELEMTGLPGLGSRAYAAWGDSNGDGKLEIALIGSEGQVSNETARIYTLNECLPCAIICPEDITVDAATGMCSAVVEYPDVQTTKNCGDLVFDPPSGSEFSVGETTVTIMTGDEQTSCSFIVTVNDIDPPSITCPENMIVDAGGDECGAIVNFEVPASDECGAVTVESFPPSGAFFRVGTTTVNSIATDAAGLTATCSFTITVRDVTPPVLECLEDIEVDAAPNECSATVDFEVIATDNCRPILQLRDPIAVDLPGMTLEYSHAPGSVFPVGVTDVTTTATDTAGNFSVCTFKVTVNDAQPPTISCPQNIVVDTDAGQCGAVVEFNVGASDTCSNVTVVSTPASGSMFPVGTTTVTSVATDSSGNPSRCSFTVTVNDNQPPTITCPADIVVNSDAAECGAIVAFGDISASDNCSIATIETAPESGSFFAIGVTDVVTTATDASGNVTTCSFTVTVNDNQPPTITCPADIVVIADENESSKAVSFDLVASDNCGTPNVQSVPASGSAFPIGTTRVTVTATDGSGNEATCSFTVTVRDAEAPVLTCPTDIVRDADENQCSAEVFFEIQASDNDDEVTVESAPPSGSRFDVGVTDVITTATDTTGNVTTCTFTVTIRDVQPPTITCPADIDVVADENASGKAVSFDLVASDNCGTLNIQSVPASGSTFFIGTTDVLATATDAAGNQTTCTFTVTVRDAQAPTILCPEDVVVDAEANQCSSEVTFEITASDNNGDVHVESAPASGSRFDVGVTDVLTTATDIAGNMTTCTFTVTVRDAQAPTITCPADIIVDADLNECSKTVTFDLVASDNCSTVTVESMPETGALFPIGVTDILTTATDATGNVTTCTFTVTVRDVTPPSLPCPADMDVPSDDGVDGAIVHFTAEATDDCSLATVEFEPESGSLLPLGENSVVATATDASGNQTSCTFTVRVRDANPGMDAGWVPSGINSGPDYRYDANSIDDVDIERGDGALSVIVRPSVGRYRIAGWINNHLMSRDDVQPGQFVRGKFYVTASNPANAPMNEVPNFRIRLQNEGVVLASATYGYSATGSGGVPHEPFYDTVDSPDTEQFVSPSLRPSPDETKPSLYRLDFDPLDVPASQGTSIGALFESASTQNPSEGTLMLTEVTLGVYPVPEEGETIFFWSDNPAFSEHQTGGEKKMVRGIFNAEPNFEAGRRQDLELAEADPNAPFATVVNDGQNGWIIDTDAVPQDRFGAGLLSILGNDPAEVPRIEENKIYRGRFLVSSDVPTTAHDDTEMQGNVLLGLKTGYDGVVARLELIGPNTATWDNDTVHSLAGEVLPGIGGQIPDQPADGIIPQGEAGGWYTLQISTPLDSAITQWKGGDLSPLIDQPGPGEAPSALMARSLPGTASPDASRDIFAEMVVLQMPQKLKLGPTTTMPWAVPNRGKIRIIAIEIIKYDQINDGGYGY